MLALISLLVYYYDCQGFVSFPLSYLGFVFSYSALDFLYKGTLSSCNHTHFFQSIQKFYSISNSLTLDGYEGT